MRQKVLSTFPFWVLANHNVRFVIHVKWVSRLSYMTKTLIINEQSSPSCTNIKFHQNLWGRAQHASILLLLCCCILITWTVPGSIPGGVTGFFSDIFPSDHTTALGSTQPLVKMCTRNIPGGKGGWCMRLTTSQPSCIKCHEIWEPKPPGTLWATPGL